MKKVVVRYLLLAIFIFFIDFISKKWALSVCGSGYKIHDFIACTPVLNRGVSWSLLTFESSVGFFLVTCLTVFVSLCVAWYAWIRFNNKYSIIGECFVLAGALSNLYDRFLYGGVVDFIELQYHGYSWPIFNVADCAIVFGVVVMLLNSYWEK